MFWRAERMSNTLSLNSEKTVQLESPRHRQLQVNWMLLTEPHRPDLPGANPHGILELVLSESRMKVSRLVLRHGAGEKPLRRIEEGGRQTSGLPYRFLAMRDRRSHRASPVARPGHAGCVLEGSAEGKRSDKKPIGTYEGMRKSHGCPNLKWLTSRKLFL